MVYNLPIGYVFVRLNLYSNLGLRAFYTPCISRGCMHVFQNSVHVMVHKVHDNRMAMLVHTIVPTTRVLK